MPSVRVRKNLTDDAGLTLIEVLATIGLMGVLAAVAASNFTAMIPAYRARGAALLIAGDMNQARMAAVKEGRIYDYFPISGGYRIRRDNGFGGRDVLKEVSLATEYPHAQFGYTGISNDPYNTPIGSAVPTLAITFHSNGTVQDPAGVFVEVEHGDETFHQAVTISAAGRVRVWKYGATSWQ